MISLITFQKSSIKSSTLSLQTAWTGFETFNLHLCSSGSSSTGPALLESSTVVANFPPEQSKLFAGRAVADLEIRKGVQPLVCEVHTKILGLPHPLLVM